MRRHETRQEIMFEHLNWPKDMPKEFYWEAMETLQRQRIRELKAAHTYHEQLNKLKTEYLDRLHEIIGSEKSKAYKRLHNARLTKLRQASQVLPATRDELREREALRLRLIKESTKSIDKSGVDLAQVTALRESYAKKIATLFERTVGKGKIGKAIPKPKNIDYFPPYLLDARDYDHYESEASLPNPSLTRYFDDRTGDVGSRTRTHVSGADEWDLVSATCRTGFLVIYRNPHVGQPVLDIDLEAVDLHYHGRIRDECGGSSATVRQYARVFGQVYSGGGEAVRTYCPTYLIHNHRSGREDTWSETVLPTGSDFTLSFVLATPVPADTYVLIGVGVETYNNFLSNDCEVDSTIEARLLVRRIGVTTTW